MPTHPRQLEPHLPCTDCGYDLHGVDRRGACPECGMAIRWSRRDARLIRVRRHRVRRTALALLLFAMFMGIVFNEPSNDIICGWANVPLTCIVDDTFRASREGYCTSVYLPIPDAYPQPGFLDVTHLSAAPQGAAIVLTLAFVLIARRRGC